MLVPRAQHTATLLTNGTVLFTGGVMYSGGDPRGTTLASTEIFDPASATFTAGASMGTARRMHSATLLPDGRVLIAGGYLGDYATSTAEVYDPSAGTFASTGSMKLPRGGHSAILLRDGTVLIVGGYGGNFPDVPNAEVYDPATGAFTETGSYRGRGGCDFCAPSVLLANGQVLFDGQYPAQLYDPRSGSFTPTGQALGDESTAVLLMNGQVLFTGGEDLGRSNSAELYDPVTGAFAATGSMAWRRVWHTLTLLPDGTVLTTGGETDSCGAGFCMFAGSVASAEIFDPSSGSFVATGSMTEARETHTATLLNDGRVLIAGGVSYGGIGAFFGGASTAEIYTPAVRVAAPVLLSTSNNGTRVGLIAHAATGAMVTADDPAVAGEILVIAYSGLPDGSMISPYVSIGGRLADIFSFGAVQDAPGTGALRVRMPRGVAPGPAVTVRLSYIDRTSNDVTLAVRAGRDLRIPQSPDFRVKRLPTTRSNCASVPRAAPIC
jgi:hypothetical protein